ncbi:GNAT family N-acetyltransferase [Chitinolyticbacter meiyuanensis]|uniref:GNAT family N-acetyltransferase n=1 Tax=Chitinolyticbacter meiyuanensis TaxID=682798 RepID=UPI001FE35801|nr:GNAT family N-acetyltransferase [Chitinolyticbacter meiyuanensis]
MLATARLLLQPLRDEDFDAAFAIASDSVVVRSSGYPAPRDALALGRAGWQRWGVGSVGLWRGDTLIGQIELIYNTLDEFQIGWLQHPDHWGRGYMREACEALLAHAFLRAGLSLMTAYTFDHNRRSVRLLQSLGFGATRSRLLDGEMSTRYELRPELQS